jgi:hypothetical protein
MARYTKEFKSLCREESIYVFCILTGVHARGSVLLAREGAVSSTRPVSDIVLRVCR